MVRSIKDFAQKTNAQIAQDNNVPPITPIAPITPISLTSPQKRSLSGTSEKRDASRAIAVSPDMVAPSGVHLSADMTRQPHASDSFDLGSSHSPCSPQPPCCSCSAISTISTNPPSLSSLPTPPNLSSPSGLPVPPIPVDQAGKIAGCTLLSRVLGLVRDMVIVAALGLGADIFFMAFRIPNIMRRMAAEGVLGMAHTARLGNMQSDLALDRREDRQEIRQKIGQEAGYEARYETGYEVEYDAGREGGYKPRQKTAPQQSLGENIRGINYSLHVALIYGAVTTLVAALLWLFAPFCMRLVAPGFDEGRLQETVLLFRWCLAYLPLAAATAILAATLIAYGRAGYATLAPVLLNLGILLVGVGAFITGEGVYFAAGVVVGGALQLAWLLLWMYRLLFTTRQFHDSGTQSDGDENTLAEPNNGKKGYPADGKLQKALWTNNRPDNNGKQPSDETPCCTSLRRRLRSALRVFLTVTIGSSAYLYFFMSSVGASLFFPGAVSAMYIGERFIEFPLAIIGSSIGMAFMPQFSRLVHSQDALRTALEKTLRLSCLVAFPAALGIILFHNTIVSLFFGHGAMGLEEVMVTAKMLAIMGCSLPAFCLSRQIMGGLIALAGAPSFGAGQGCGDRLLRFMGRSVWGGCGVVLTSTVLFGSWLGLGAVAWGVAIAAWGQCLYLWHLACKKMAFIRPLKFFGQQIPLVGALFLLAVGLWGVKSVLDHIENMWLAGGLLCIAVVGVAFGWIKGLALWGNDEANLVWETWRKIWR